MDNTQRHVAELGQLPEVFEFGRLAHLAHLDGVKCVVERLGVAPMLPHRLPEELALADGASHLIATAMISLAHRILH